MGGDRPPPRNATTLRPSLLFTAPSDGLYRCHLVAYTGSASSVMTAHEGLTYLMLSAADEVGSHWWQNPDCDSEGKLPTCTYLGDPHGAKETFIFFSYPNPAYQWAAADNATQASVTANVELTECGHTASCGGRRYDFDRSTVKSHLEAVQFDAVGNPCNVTKSPDRTDVIGKYRHHYNIAYSLPDVPVLATCGGWRRFLIGVNMTWVSGNPVKIDGSRPDPDVNRSEAETNAFAVNSYYAPTTARVPSVTGLSQAAAQNALAAAHLNLGTVTNVNNSAPAGTVLGQNAPGGTVEPTNSPVNITVSIGVTTVPDLVTTVPDLYASTQSEATSLLTAAGLVVGTGGSLPTDDADLANRVVIQYTASGTQVARGTVVSFALGRFAPNHCGPNPC